MSIFKSLTLVCAGFLCAGISVRAQDNAAQSAARAALLQKMQDMDNQGDNSTTPFPSTPVDVPRQPSRTTVVTQTPAYSAPTPAYSGTTVRPAPSAANQAYEPRANAPYTPHQDNAAQNAARAALMQKMQDMDVQDMNTATLPGNQSSGGPAMAPIATNAPVQNEPFFEPAPQMDSPLQPPQRPLPIGKKRIFSPYQHQSAGPRVDSYGFAPVQPPPAPVSSDKEAALHALLARYRADLMSPSEYQAERARILSEP